MLASLLGSLLRHPLRAWRARSASRLFDAAIAQKDAGAIADALRNLQQAVARDPGHVQAHHWLGILHARGQAYADSARHLEHALALDSGNAELWVDLGNVYALQREWAKAGASYRAALAVNPDSLLARLNLGSVLIETGYPDEAIPYLQSVYDQAPELENALRNLVVALIGADRCEEALAVAAKAAARDPASYEAQFIHGLALQKLHAATQALACYDSALALRRDDPELHDNRGSALLELGRLEEALASHERALALRPDFTLAAFHRALLYLLRKDYARGWEHYELRQLDRDYPRRTSAYPVWDGASLAGRVILLYREQGLGDEIMFASCVPQVIEMAEHCIIECEPRLLGLFRRSFPAATVYEAAPDGGLPRAVTRRKVDVAIPAGSVPRFLRRDLAAFPRHDGYLKADPLRVARWRERLSGWGPGLKVGVAWTGGVRKTRRGLRSIPIEQWLPILETPGACFVSLQHTGDAGATVAALRDRHGIRFEHWPDAVDDYDETAALVCALDLVVSVCTAVIHLGGALGRPVWVMAPYSPEWRYGFTGETMPWYPSVKVMRQPAFGAWGPVIAATAAGLRQVAGRSTGALHPAS